ncbi:hypothetical protein RIF29_30664 [Crotalaria pallida]|uniref:F-box domain-containing protein n=1 Tax=Crotalaria pallida TaxID=3830 RepID=A0AAN9HYD5_CROPI
MLASLKLNLSEHTTLSNFPIPKPLSVTLIHQPPAGHHRRPVAMMCFSEGKPRQEMEHLPEEVIILILMLLPVKSLLRFKCVSKSWFSIISDFKFANSHFDLAAAPITHRVLYKPVKAYASQTWSIDLDGSSLSAASVVLNPRFLPPNSNVEIKGSCRGFILLRITRLSSCFSLWNPSTGSHKLIYRSPIMASNAEGNHDSTFFFGFGYDVATDDYLVVLASYDHAAEYQVKFELFSLRANTWNKLECTNLDYDNGSYTPKTGIFLNGIIHWFARRRDVGVSIILAFNLTERSFSEVPLLPHFNHRDAEFSDLCVLGGRLGLCVRDGDRADTADIWVMEEYKVQSSWTKLIVVSMDGIPIKYFFLICSTKSGDIVGLDGGTRLLKFNANGQLLEHHTYWDDRYHWEAAIYTESLLSLPVDYEQA